MLFGRVNFFPLFCWLSVSLPFLALPPPFLTFFHRIIRRGRWRLLRRSFRWLTLLRWRALMSFLIPLPALWFSLYCHRLTTFFTTCNRLPPPSWLALVFSTFTFMSLVFLRVSNTTPLFMMILRGLLVSARFLTALSDCARDGRFLRGVVHHGAWFSKRFLPLVVRVVEMHTYGVQVGFWRDWVDDGGTGTTVLVLRTKGSFFCVLVAWSRIYLRDYELMLAFLVIVIVIHLSLTTSPVICSPLTWWWKAISLTVVIIIKVIPARKVMMIFVVTLYDAWR